MYYVDVQFDLASKLAFNAVLPIIVDIILTYWVNVIRKGPTR